VNKCDSYIYISIIKFTNCTIFGTFGSLTILFFYLLFLYPQRSEAVLFFRKLSVEMNIFKNGLLKELPGEVESSQIKQIGEFIIIKVKYLE